MESTTERTRLVAPGIWCGRREQAVARDENLESLAATECPVAP
jgi:hypothetical protein